VLLARQASPSAGWSDWLTALRDQPEGPSGSVLVAAISLPDIIGDDDTFYMGVGYAVIPLSMSVVLLAGFGLVWPRRVAGTNRQGQPIG
jgi:hypothetical protein